MKVKVAEIFGGAPAPQPLRTFVLGPQTLCSPPIPPNKMIRLGKVERSLAALAAMAGPATSAQFIQRQEHERRLKVKLKKSVVMAAACNVAATILYNSLKMPAQNRTISGRCSLE